MTSYELITIGAGNAGIAAASAAAKAGWKVAVIEGRDVGGTCPLRGCVPKKVLVAAAETLDTIARAGDHHIDVEPPRLDWARLIERKQGFVAGVPEAFESSLAERGIDVIKGKARFVASHAVEVAGRELRANKLVVATGSVPRPLPIDGVEHVITSDEFLDLGEQPQSIVFLGGGVISMEFGHVLARAGTKVTILELLERPLVNFDADAVDRMVSFSRELGIDIVTNARPTAVEAHNGGFVVRAKVDGSERRFQANVVMNGAGRVAAVSDLNLDAANIDHDGNRVAVDGFLRSCSNPDVFFAGDSVAGRPQLSPVATYEGRIVGHNLLHPDDLQVPSYTAVPSAVYTVPALTQVGYSVARARAEGLELDVVENDMNSWRSARMYAERRAYAKILIDRAADRIVGAHLLGHGAAETIHTFALAIEHQIPASRLKDTVYAYPTFSSDIKYLL